MDIGVIGGGASAVCFLNSLSQSSLLPPGRLTVFEPSARLWRGRAYQRDSEAVRLNTPPAEMSVRAGDPGHFERWLAALDRAADRSPAQADAETDPHIQTRFVPRTVYGEYLERSAAEAVTAMARSGRQTGVVRDAVQEIAPDGDGVAVRTAQGRCQRFDKVVLCIGAGRPPDVYGLAGLPDYVPDPYPVSGALAGIDPDAEVAVIGTGLTAVDIVLALAGAGHRGPVTMVSRSGVLPAVRPRASGHRLRHFTPSRFRASTARGERVGLTEVAALLAMELARAGTDIAALRAEVEAVGREEPVARLRRQLRGLDTHGPALGVLQKSVPSSGPELWTAMAEPDKDFLLDRHYRTAMSLCCPMPPHSAGRLLELFAAGRLAVARDVLGVAADPRGGFAVTTGTGGFHADVVVNAVNPRMRRPDAGPGALVASLLAGGIAERHPRGGLAVEPDTSRVTAAGVPDPRVFALGDLGMGSLFFTFGIPSLLDRSVDVVDSMVREEFGVDPRPWPRGRGGCAGGPAAGRPAARR